MRALTRIGIVLTCTVLVPPAAYVPLGAAATLGPRARRLRDHSPRMCIRILAIGFPATPPTRPADR